MKCGRRTAAGLPIGAVAEVLYDEIQGLSPKDDKQTANHAQALGFAIRFGTDADHSRSMA